MAYIHENPVNAGWVENVSEWYYSSQRNYSDLPAPLEIDLIDIAW